MVLSVRRSRFLKYKSFIFVKKKCYVLLCKRLQYVLIMIIFLKAACGLRQNSILFKGFVQLLVLYSQKIVYESRQCAHDRVPESCLG